MSSEVKGLKLAIKGLACVRRGIWTLDQYEQWLELCIMSADGQQLLEGGVNAMCELLSSVNAEVNRTANKS